MDALDIQFQLQLQLQAAAASCWIMNQIMYLFITKSCMHHPDKLQFVNK